MKNKNTEIQEIEKEMRALADRLEQIKAAKEQPKPRAGEVWQVDDCAPEILTENHGWIYLGASAGTTSCGIGFSALPVRCLGTFNEVYIEREKVREVVHRALAERDFCGHSLDDDTAFGRFGCQKVIATLKELL